MQTFDAAEGRHDFEFGGGKYYLIGFGFGDSEFLTSLADVSDQKVQVSRYRAFIARHARYAGNPVGQFLSGKKLPGRAVMALNPKQIAELFAAWTGRSTPGESSASPDSQ